MNRSVISALALLWVLSASPVRAQQPDPGDPSPYSEAELVSEVLSVRPGVPFTVGLRLTLEPEWHSYWRNPGDSGEPTSIEWRLPAGFTAGEIEWPAPRAIPFPPLLSYGYFDGVLLPVEISPPGRLAPGDTVRLEGTAYWLVCIEDCFPAEAELSLALPVEDTPPERDPRTAPLFDAARASMPAAADGWTSLARANDRFLGLRLDPPGESTPFFEGDLSAVRFFAASPEEIDHAAEQRPDWDGETLAIRLVRSGFATGFPDTLRGVLVLERDASGDATRSVDVRAPVVVAGRPGEALVPGGSGPGAGSDAPASGFGPLLAVLFAFLGGMLLNLMPCVFPVLSLKVLGFVEDAGREDGGAAGHGFAFAAGVIVSFWVLGGLLLLLRSAGESVGWGFQLQSPLFVGAMALLFFLLGLSLIGAFEIGLVLTRLGDAGSVKVPSRVPGSEHGAARSFASGVLATLVATPCTAPFMGAALGWALVRPPAETMLVFTALGAGMAAPYVALSLAPGLLDRLPPPGRWMVTFKQLLAFPLFATVVWLAWVFGLQTGVSGLTGLLVALLLAGLAVWIAKRWGGIERTGAGRTVSRIAAAAVGIGAIFVMVRASRLEPVGAPSSTAAEEGPTAGAEVAEWIRWSPDAAERALASGDALFIDYTAAWCLSCQVNERLVLGTDDVLDAFREHGVTLMKADWTRRDAEITAALADLGRSSVPVYALYPPGAGADGPADPILLPSVLTSEIVLDALDTHVRSRERGSPNAPEAESEL